MIFPGILPSVMPDEIIIAVSGSIAAYKTCDLIRLLTRRNLPVRVLMTKNATRFVGPTTFQALTGRPVQVDEWEKGMLHIDIKNSARVFAVVPATASIIGKFAAGIADDVVTSSYLAVNCPVLVAPAMNPNMYNHPAVQRNLKTLSEDGILLIDPARGEVVCGDTGQGKLAPLDEIESAILKAYESR
jgi:phosphopantothenoylcysteine decarboxylase/phosphopantothenoylcysteine decarboxylase/phosphopantothenate--cysteine ligase